MYAVIKTGGQQFRVAENDVVTVDRLEGEVGSKVSLGEVLLVGKDADSQVGSPFVTGAKVEAVIVAQKLSKKIDAFNYKPKKNVRKKWGHRQQLTEIRVTKITAGK